MPQKDHLILFSSGKQWSRLHVLSHVQEVRKILQSLRKRVGTTQTAELCSTTILQGNHNFPYRFPLAPFQCCSDYDNKATMCSTTPLTRHLGCIQHWKGGEGGATAKRLVRANNFVNDCSVIVLIIMCCSVFLYLLEIARKMHFDLVFGNRQIWSHGKWSLNFKSKSKS